MTWRENMAGNVWSPQVYPHLFYLIIDICESWFYGFLLREL